MSKTQLSKFTHLLLSPFLIIILQLSTVYAVSDRIIPVKESNEVTIAFGSCNNYRFNNNPVIFDEIIDHQPDVWIWVGDSSYVRYKKDHEFISKNDFDLVKYSHNYQKLLKQMPVIGTWDDHDFGKNDGDKHFEKKDYFRKLYLDFLDEPEDSIRRTRKDGLYESYYIGEEKKVKAILLDVRYNRDFRYNYSSQADTLGKEQWKWFETELKDSNVEFFLIFSGSQVLSDDKTVTEHWFENSRNQLEAVLKENKVSGAILFSGDVHMTEILKHPCPERVGTNLYEFTSSGLTHSIGDWNMRLTMPAMISLVPKTFNTPKDRYYYRNFGKITIKFEEVKGQQSKQLSEKDDTEDEIENSGKSILLEAYSYEGKLVLKKEIDYSELTFNESLAQVKNQDCPLNYHPMQRVLSSILYGIISLDQFVLMFCGLGIIAVFLILLILSCCMKMFKSLTTKKVKKE